MIYTLDTSSKVSTFQFLPKSVDTVHCHDNCISLPDAWLYTNSDSKKYCSVQITVQIRKCDLLSDGTVFRELHEHDCGEKGGIAAGGGDRRNHNNQHAGKLVGMKHRQCAFLPLPDCSRGFKF